MDARLARSVALIIVITVLGIVGLRRRATELRSQLAAGGARAAEPTADSDSAAVVDAALRALQADDSARGGARDTAPRQVLRFERDTAGVLVTLVPLDPLSPADGALIRVPRRGIAGGPWGPARLVERYPGH